MIYVGIIVTEKGAIIVINTSNKTENFSPLKLNLPKIYPPRQLVNTTIAVDTTDENKLFHSQVINGASVNTFLYPDTIHSDGKNVVGILIISALLLKDSIKHQKNGNATTIKATAIVSIIYYYEGLMKENNNNTIYKYSQLYDILLEKILANEWKANDKMPTERELSIRYNVSRVTVRDTLNRLAQAGYIYRIQGKGTFVSVRKIEKN